MKESAQNLILAIEKTNKIFGDYLQDMSSRKTTSMLVNSWNKLLEKTEDVREQLDKFEARLFVEEEIKLPYHSEKFAKAWDDWKIYLAQQWSAFLSNKREQKTLALLKEWCKDDEEQAIFILDYSIVAGAKTPFYTTKEIVEKAKIAVSTGNEKIITDETSML